MFYIIETHTQLLQLYSILKGKQCFIKLIPLNNNYHPAILAEYGPSLLYIKATDDKKGYLICFKHSECVNELKWDDNFKAKINHELLALSYNVKELMYYGIDCYGIEDIYFYTYEYRKKYKEWINNTNNCINYYYQKYPSNIELNCLIPLSKHYEYCEELAKQIPPYQSNNNSYFYRRIIKTYYNIEKQGISIDKDKFIQYYSHIQHPEYNIKEGKIYTYYNLYTLTGRPSNSFNGINFMALNKENGERSIFIPENNLFVEYDIQGYHPRIIDSLINKVSYFPIGSNVYEYLNIEKEEMFQNMYGNISDKWKNNIFFTRLQEYINKEWEKFQQTGRLELITHYLDKEEIENPTPSKILNYIIQNTETYLNSQKIFKHYPILCVYDSFLFDVNTSKEIKESSNFDKNLKSTKIGVNYHNLIKF